MPIRGCERTRRRSRSIAGPDRPAGIGFNSAVGALDEGENQALDGRREPRGTASEKFY